MGTRFARIAIGINRRRADATEAALPRRHPPPRPPGLLALLASAAVLLTGAATAFSADLRVLAAASTTDAISEVSSLFEAEGGGKVIPTFASSSTLAKQIENGAPADVFISASEEWMDYLEERDLIAEGSRTDLLGNRLVLIAPADSPLGAVDVREGFPLAALRDGGRLVMGDPDHVPAGVYGKATLEALGVWEAVEPRLARAADVRAALVLVERGEAPLGVVYATDAAISDRVKVLAELPADSHPAITYPAAVVASGDEAAAREFLEFLRGLKAREVFERHGFTLD